PISRRANLLATIPPRFAAFTALAAFVALVAVRAVAAVPVMLIPAVPGTRLAGSRLINPEPLPAREVAVSMPFTVWFPVNVLLPFVSATPPKLTVWVIVAVLAAKLIVSGV